MPRPKESNRAAGSRTRENYALSAKIVVRAKYLVNQGQTKSNEEKGAVVHSARDGFREYFHVFNPAYCKTNTKRANKYAHKRIHKEAINPRNKHQHTIVDFFHY